MTASTAAANFAFANRQVLAYHARRAFEEVLAGKLRDFELRQVYDIAHNMAKIETHDIGGQRVKACVHRKGATRAFGPGHLDLPEPLRIAGQPVLIGGSMGTSSYVLAGTHESESLAFSSACHGAGRAMSRHEALKHWRGRQVVDDLAARGIIVKSATSRGIAEEAPGAYKDVAAVVDAADEAGLACKVARLQPLICVKG